MNTALSTQKDRAELIAVLQSSLYVGAKYESVDMLLSYCEVAGLDVMQKPVHIVPINAEDPVTGQYVWRDVVMPGVGLYRIQADRSGTMAGISEPEFGPDVTETFTDKNNKQVTVTFPEWCRVAVKKLVGGHVVEFVAKEYWVENYATDSGKSSAPNAMWSKRKRGQLAKCAEAQALRKAFPEVGAAPTAEEMEGKAIEPRDMGQAERVEPGRAEIPPYSAADFETNLPTWKQYIQAGKKPEDIISMISSKFTLTDEQKKKIRDCAVNTETGEVLEGEVA